MTQSTFTTVKRIIFVMKAVVEIIRLETGTTGTFGVLRFNKAVFCFTLEPPDRANKANMSHIPAGQYECKRTNSPKFGNTFVVLDVPDRNLILFHAGNKVQDTSGCIILGSSIGKLKGDRAVLNSGVTFRNFIFMLEYSDNFSLTIKEVY